jgi:N-carbamoyl-L-amino-acid hydrolase
VSIIETLPGSPNTVPGRLRFIVDLRHPLADHYHSLRQEVDLLVTEALLHQGLKGSIRCVWEAAGVEFDADCIDAVRAATVVLQCTAMEMVSGAGHDSVNIAAVVPTAMIFVPCAGGLSHNEAESALQSDLEAGANVLLLAMTSLASAASRS